MFTSLCLFVRPASLSLALATAWLCLATSVLAGPPAAVSFDAPAIVVAEPIDSSLASGPTTGGNLLRLKMPVSALIDPNFRGQVEEFIVEIDTPSRSLRVLDFWPKMELYSQVDGTISVQNQSQKNQNYSFNVSGGYEPFARGAASGDYRGQQQVDERYVRRPPMQMLTSSGTVGRGYGAFFKFRPGPTPVLEGDREIALLVEAPSGWRADLLRINMRAVGSVASPYGGTEMRELGTAQFWTAVHHVHDTQAAQAARRYVASEQSLRRVAAASQQSIEHRSLPTVFHKVGAALDVVEPKIPSNYLDRILFDLNQSYFDATASRLPVDLRVAVLDYWDERARMMNLASVHM